MNGNNIGTAAQAHIYFSDFFDIDPAILEDYGAFNVSLINDLALVQSVITQLQL